MQAMITFISSPSSLLFSHTACAVLFPFYNFPVTTSLSPAVRKTEKLGIGPALCCGRDIKAVIDYIL